MNFKVFIFAVSAAIVGLVELIVGGILPIIAKDLNITIDAAGQLITVFALVFAFAGPILLSVTAKIERKKLYLFALAVFFAGNVLTYFSPDFVVMMIARIITAMGASLVIVLSLTITTRIVEPVYRARALGLIYMGISSALVLGVPVGILIANAFGWRAVFLGIALLSIGSFVLIYAFLERMSTEKVLPVSAQIRALGNLKIMSAHVATMLMLAGHYTVYAYFAPFLETTLHLNQNWISATYFIFGLAAISGGALGGKLTELLGPPKSILLIMGAFSIILFLLPYSTFSYLFFLGVMVAWGALSWAIPPPMQTYLIQTDPCSSDIHQSLNNSVLQLGIALGAGVGGVSLGYTGSVVSTAHVGAGIVLGALLCVVFSLKMPVNAAPRAT